MTAPEHLKAWYWSKCWARPYDRYRIHHELFWKLINNEVPDKSSVLDMGCGPSALWEGRDIELTGVDFSDQALIQSQVNFPQGRFLQNDIRAIPLREKFDYVVLSGVVNYVEDLDPLLEEIDRLSRDKIIITINQVNDFPKRTWSDELIKETFRLLGEVKKVEFYKGIGWYIVISKS